MIVTPVAGRLRIVTQPDHAGFSRELLSLWRAGGLPEHPRRAEILFAAREHDNGWREADAAPRIDGEGRPLDFLTTPPGLRREIWDRGTRRYLEKRPYAALLILQHACRLHRGQEGDPAWGEFLSTLRERREELREALGIPVPRLEEDYRWIDLADALSLAVCRGSEAPFDRQGVSAHPEEDTLRVAPFPLAGATTFTVPCRSIPDRPYTNGADLATELAGSRWSAFEVRIAP